MLQPLASVAFPGHVSLPPGTGLLHDRALNSTPGPQEAEHWDHSPQCSHSVTATVKWSDCAIKKFLNRIPEHLSSKQSLASVESPKHCVVSSRHVRRLTVRPFPHVEVQEDQSPH